MGCPNCGTFYHKNHNQVCCGVCGTKLIPCTDSRDVCPEAKQKAFDDLQKAIKKFKQELDPVLLSLN